MSRLELFCHFMQALRDTEPVGPFLPIGFTSFFLRLFLMEMCSWLAHCFPVDSKFVCVCVCAHACAQQRGQSLVRAEIDWLTGWLIAWLSRQRDGRYFNHIFCLDSCWWKYVLLNLPWTLPSPLTPNFFMDVTSHRTLPWSLHFSQIE